MVVDLGVANMLLALVLPLAVNVVTKEVTSRAVKSLLLVVLSVATGVVTTVVGGGGVIDNAVVGQAVTTFVIAIAAHYGLWKPTGATDKVAELSKGVGIS